MPARCGPSASSAADQTAGSQFARCTELTLAAFVLAERPDSGHLYFGAVGQQQASHDHAGLHHPRAQRRPPEPA